MTVEKDKLVDKTTKSAKQDELVQISRREQRLRERLLTVDEDLIHDENRLHANGERRKRRLTKQINRTRARQKTRLNRREKSKLYHRSKALYVLCQPFYALGRGAKWIYNKITGRVEHHKQVTPHRSFYLTTHAKAVRQINISGYFRFIHEVGRQIWDNKWLYFKALLLLSLLITLVVGFGATSNYVEVRDALEASGIGYFYEIVGLFTQAIITSTTMPNTGNQAFFVVLILIAWLVLIYIARHIYNGRTKLKLRDAIYNACGGLVSLLAIVCLVIVQLLPLAITLISYSAISGAGYINEGIEIENMAAWCVIAAVLIMTIYWMVTSLLTMITITIPGIYPLRAYFETSVLVSGRRIKILLRLLMMFVPIVLLWLVVLTPMTIIDLTVKFKSFPLIQLTTSVLVAASFIWMTAYLYMLYRRLIDSPEQPIGTPNSKIVWPWLRKRRAKQIAEAASEAGTNDGE